MNIGVWSNLLRKRAIAATFFPVEEESIFIRKKIGISENSMGKDLCKLFMTLAMIFIWKRLHIPLFTVLPTKFASLMYSKAKIN